MPFKNVFFTILTCVLLISFACGDEVVIGLFNGETSSSTNSSSSGSSSSGSSSSSGTLPDINVDYFIAFATSNGVYLATHTNGSMINVAVGDSVGACADRKGNVYFIENNKGDAFGIITNLGAGWRNYGSFSGHFGFRPSCDNAGNFYCVQTDPLGAPTQAGFNRGTGFLSLLEYISHGGERSTCTAVNEAGTFCLGTTNGDLYIATGAQATGLTNTTAWATTMINHVAISGSGTIVVASGNQLRNSVGTWADQTFTYSDTITALVFSGETLYVGMNNARIALSQNYGETNRTVTSGLLGNVVGLGPDRNGRLLVAAENGNVYQATDAGNSSFNSLYTTGASGRHATVVY